jgi:hypothetical protein
MTKPRLNADQRCALALLASDERGQTELMLALGFRREMLAGLVLAGLVTETMRAGGATMKVERYLITDAGRDALAESRRRYRRRASGSGAQEDPPTEAVKERAARTRC